MIRLKILNRNKLIIIMLISISLFSRCYLQHVNIVATNLIVYSSSCLNVRHMSFNVEKNEEEIEISKKRMKRK